MRAIFVGENKTLRTGWRVLAMVLLLGGTAWLIDVGWRAVGLPTRDEGGPWFYALRAVVVAFSALGIVLCMLRWIEHQGSQAIRLPFEASAFTTTLLGTLLGAVPIGLFVVSAALSGFASVARGTMSAALLVTTMLPLLIAGFLLAAWEELTLRGYLLRELSLGLSPAAAVVITGLLFGLLHGANPGATWAGILFTGIGGILLGWLTLRSGSLWPLIGYHFGWNATASAVFGLELSGFEQEASLFATTLHGADWLTGGTYGFEASVLPALLEVAVLSATLRFLRPRR